MTLSSFDARIFVAIAELGSLSAAARRLGLQKSFVSRELAALEARLNVRLLQRTTRRISLTDAGEILLGYAQRIVEEAENAQAALASLAEAPRGELRATAPHAIARFVIVPALHDFQQRYPEIRLSLNPAIKVIDLVHEGIDVAIRVGELPPSGLVTRKLATVPLVLVASTAYAAARGLPNRVADLAGHDLLTLGPRTAGTIWTFHQPGHPPVAVPVAPRLAMPEPGLILDLALRSTGIAVVPLHYASDPLRSGTLLRVLPEMTLGARPVHAVYPSRRLLTPKVRVFIDFVAEIFAAAAM
jgi:DNA-binding transcriptional LysR family regulator